MTHSYGTWLIHTRHDLYQTYRFHMRHDSFTWDMTHAYWSKEPPPPGGVSYLLCSLIKNPEEEDPFRRICTRCLEGGPLPPGSWSGNIVNRKPPGGCDFFRSISLQASPRDMAVLFRLLSHETWLIHMGHESFISHGTRFMHISQESPSDMHDIHKSCPMWYEWFMSHVNESCLMGFMYILQESPSDMQVLNAL